MARSRRGGAGGIEGLVALINEHGEALDADLQHYYQIPLSDLATGRLTFRRLGALIRGLPGDGTAMWRAGRRTIAPDAKGSPPPADFWTPDRDLLASVVDLLAVQVWQKTKDATKGRNAPKPIQRPGITPEKTYGKPRSVSEVLALLRPDVVADGDEPHDQPDAADDPEGDTPSGEG